MISTLPTLAALVWVLLAPLQPPITPDDPRVRQVVERFFATQEAEDADAYLALWSRKATRPRPEQLAFVFKAGDDKFSDLAIERVTRIGDLLRVTVSVRRERTSSVPSPDGSRSVSTTVRQWSLALTEEEGELRIFSEGFPADALAVALIEAATAAERAALMDAEAGLLDTRLLQALSMRAVSQTQLGQHGAARAIHERLLEVARRMGNRKAEGEALQNIGNTYYFENRHAEALDHYQQRLALERDPLNEAGAAGALLGIATIKYSSFEYGAALDAYREALVFYEALDDEAGSATALLSTGNVLYLQGDLEGAIADYRRSRDLYKRTHNTDGEARALAGLGRVLVAQGNYAPALEAFDGVAEEGRARKNRIMQANASQSIGEVHLRLGNAAAARAAFDETRAHLEAAGDASGVGRAWQGAALAELIGGRFGAAEQAYERSIAACGEAADHDCVARAVVGLAWALFSQQRHAEAIVQYRKAIEAFTTLGKLEDVGRAEVGLSQALFGMQEFGQAAAAAFEARDRSPVQDVVWRARLAEARARRQLRQIEGARASAEAAVQVVEAMGRAALDRPLYRIPPDTAEAFTFLAVMQADAGDPLGAWDTAERGRAHALRAALALNERDIARGLSAEERDAERAAAARVGSLQAQIEKEQGLPKPDAERITRLEAQLADAMAERAAERARLFERRPDLHVWRGLAPAATTQEIGAFARDEDTAIVQFLIDRDDLLVLTAEPPAEPDEEPRFGAHVARLARHALADLVADAIRSPALRDLAAWHAAAAPLADAILTPARSAIDAADRLVLIPDDVLWRVPFEAMPSGERGSLAALDLSYAASATALLRASEVVASPRAENQPAPLVAVAAPELPEARRAAIGRTAPDWPVRDEAAAIREVEAVVSPFDDPPALVLRGAEVTEARLRETASGAQILHLAVPFRISSASPLFSPLLLTRPPATPRDGDEPDTPPDPSDDGVLEPREVMNLDLRADAVVLSDGGAAAMRDAAGALGTIAWAWRAAGASAVMVKRWSPDEEGDGDALIADVVARLASGEPPAAALSGARTARPPAGGSAPPGSWAAWIVIR